MFRASQKLGDAQLAPLSGQPVCVVGLLLLYRVCEIIIIVEMHLLFIQRFDALLRENMQNYNIVNATKSVSECDIKFASRGCGEKETHCVFSIFIQYISPLHAHLCSSFCSSPHNCVLPELILFEQYEKQGKRKWKRKTTTSFFML